MSSPQVCVKPFAVLSALSVTWWVVWLVLPPFVPGDYQDNHWWNAELKAQYASALACPRFADADEDAPRLTHAEEHDYIERVKEGEVGRGGIEEEVAPCVHAQARPLGRLPPHHCPPPSPPQAIPGMTDDDYIACFQGLNESSGEMYDILTKDTSDAVQYQCNACLAPFVLWVQPAVLSIALATYAALAHYLGAGHSVPRKFSTVLGMILIAVWVAAGLGSLGGNLSASIFACVIAGFIALASCDMYAHGFDSFKEHFIGSGRDWEARLAGYEDFLRGVAVYTVSPLLVVRFTR